MEEKNKFGAGRCFLSAVAGGLVVLAGQFAMPKLEKRNEEPPVYYSNSNSSIIYSDIADQFNLSVAKLLR